jgi:hypothetical protein
MGTKAILVIGFLAGATALDAAEQGGNQALERMVAAERAFAAATAEIGVRDGFLTFFAEDAVSISAGAAGATVGRARDGLRKMPVPRLPLASKLIWEPFTGLVSKDGTLGWLTGAFVAVDQLTQQTRRKGAYFSVWKLQGDGTWRVWLDEGVSLPEVWTDARPFRPATAPEGDSPGAEGEALEAAERDVVEGGEPWNLRLAAGVRLHREGQMPIPDRERAIEWSRHWKRLRYSPVRSELAGSGDLAVTLGAYEGFTGGGKEHGIWVRVWQRNSGGRWQIVFETSKKSAGN